MTDLDRAEFFQTRIDVAGTTAKVGTWFNSSFYDQVTGEWRYTLRVDGKVATETTLMTGATVQQYLRFPPGSGQHTIRIHAYGQLVDSATVTT